MELRIISPLVVETHDVDWVEVHTTEGSFVVQQGHAPTVALLAPQEPLVYYSKNGKQESHMITSGIIEINRTYIKVIMS